MLVLSPFPQPSPTSGEGVYSKIGDLYTNYLLALEDKEIFPFRSASATVRPLSPRGRGLGREGKS